MGIRGPNVLHEKTAHTKISPPPIYFLSTASKRQIFLWKSVYSHQFYEPDNANFRTMKRISNSDVSWSIADINDDYVPSVQGEASW